MARQDSNTSSGSTVINVPLNQKRHGVLESEPEIPIVSYLGPISSYTHQVYTLVQFTTPAWIISLTDFDLAQAALQCFDSDRYDYKPATTIPDVFEAVQSGEAALGVVPFENSTNGAVIFTLELLADRHASFPDITVCGEAYLDVSHCLLGRKARNSNDSSELSGTSTGTATPTSSMPSPGKPRTSPVYSIQHIKRIYTHPQAFGQCENFLQAYLKGVERIDVSSTSRAAEMVKEDTSRESAAIASSLAATVHGLDVLAQGIEDREDNTTRFFIIRKGVDERAKDTRNPTKSLISFTVDHRSPGALADVLDCFRRAKLNLTSINSRPTKVVPFQYIFFVEFEGSRLKDPDGRVEEALSGLEEHTQSWRWLGSWDDKLIKL
ncbi:Chorismate mutase [Hyphodiscus hymeniophilus]|uniref:prephenate dehydratase n=1 Tax=Hyphodiscus hymeniophilus TaxID=353542 RepID=A0A9P6VJ10_9HELO|nr:Chorismate mutase [Hyphodiscus hymeniophilus]